MRLTTIRMLSTNSLSAFSGATTTAPLDRGAAVRLVRDRATPEQQPGAAAPDKLTLPSTPPTRLMPRGSLLNLSV